MRLKSIAQLLAVVLLIAAPAHADESAWLGLRLERGRAGARAAEVMRGSPAERAGLEPGDEVLAFDEHRTPTPDSLIEAVRRAPVGHLAHLRVVSSRGIERKLALRLAEKPDMATLQHSELVGHPAPNFVPEIMAGRRVGALASLKGHVVLLDFFATWCGPCVASMPHLEEMHQRLARRGLQVIGISSESPEIVAAAAARFQLKYPLASDEDDSIASAYHVFALPTAVVIDRKGMVREVSVADSDAVDAAVAAALK